MTNSVLSKEEFLKEVTRLAAHLEIGASGFHIAISKAVCSMLAQGRTVDRDGLLAVLEEWKSQETDRECGRSERAIEHLIGLLR